MPFTTEALVRLKFQMTDTEGAPAAVLDDAIQHAHTEIMRHLAADTPLDPPPDSLILGETLLAGAYALHTLAAKDVFQHREIVVGGQRLTTGNRFAALIALADQAQKRAWIALEPCLNPIPALSLGRVTDSVPVLGPVDGH